jgi:hypothetical protein
MKVHFVIIKLDMLILELENCEMVQIHKENVMDLQAQEM